MATHEVIDPEYKRLARAMFAESNIFCPVDIVDLRDLDAPMVAQIYKERIVWKV